MEFIIKGQPKIDKRNGYILKVDAMIGDADGDKDVELGPFKKGEEDQLQDAIETCDRMLKAYPGGRGGGDDYNHIEGFEKWFEYDWPSDPMSHGQCSITGYSLIYIENGQEYDVQIKKPKKK